MTSNRVGNVRIMGATFFQISVGRGNGTWCVTGIMRQGPEAGQGVIWVKASNFLRQFFLAKFSGDHKGLSS